MTAIDRDVLAGISTVVFDLDGVVWRGSVPIDGAVETIKAFHARGTACYFLTNNAASSRREYVHKFHAIGLDFVRPGHILGAAFLAAHYLAHKAGLAGKRVYVLGADGLREELEGEGLVVDAARHEQVPASMAEVLAALPSASHEVAAVVVGFTLTATYTAMAYAHACLQRPGTLFIATNTDSTFPGAHGGMLPGGGGNVAALAGAVGRQPDAVTGKPSTYALDVLAAMRAADGAPPLDAAATLMVGDRLNTDIAMGRAARLRTLLVLTGVTTSADEAAAAADEHKPEFIAESLGAIKDLL